MPNYRRWRKEGGCFFLTVVTFDRQPIFKIAAARTLLHAAMDQACRERAWSTDGIVLLPDHWHTLWRLPEGDTDYSARVARVKRLFTEAWLALGGRERRVTAAQRRLRRRGLWQPRFWEHTIRDAADFKTHLDYIHLNPVRHGLARRPRDWPWSSFRRWVGKGEYEPDWTGRIDLAGNVEYFWHDT